MDKTIIGLDAGKRVGAALALVALIAEMPSTESLPIHDRLQAKCDDAAMIGMSLGIATVYAVALQNSGTSRPKPNDTPKGDVPDAFRNADFSF